MYVDAHKLVLSLHVFVVKSKIWHSS